MIQNTSEYVETDNSDAQYGTECTADSTLPAEHVEDMHILGKFEHITKLQVYYIIYSYSCNVK